MKKFLIYGLSNEWGGVEAIVMTMVQKLSEECYFDIIHSHGTSSYEVKFHGDNVHFVHIPAWGSDRKGFANGLKLLFTKTDYDYVWVNGCVMSNKSIISVTKKYSNAKIITHSHGSSFEESNRLKRYILLAMHKWNRSSYKTNVDYPCMCSLKSGVWFYGKDYMETHHVHYIKNGVDVGKFRFDQSIRNKYRAELGLTNEFALFHAGRLTEVKNQSRILSIFADLLKAGVNARLYIAGEGELREELETQAKALIIDDKVCFLGKRNDVNCLYQAMDVMLLPSFHEGFPVTLTEAQASGLPCIVSDRISKETNIIGLVKYLSIDTMDNKEWVETMIELSKHLNDDRLSLSEAFSVSGYDISSVCKDFIDFITTK